MLKKEPVWNWKKQERSENCETIACPEHDPIKDFKMDPAGHYVLIAPNLEVNRIEVAICDRDHKIVAVFKGRNSQDIYHAIFQHEKENGVEWFREKTHMAYLGKELKKAEMALVLGIREYFQE